MTRIFTAILTVLAFVLIVVGFSISAKAQRANCNKTQIVREKLSQQHKEAPVSMGVSGDTVIEVWRTKDGSSWSIVASNTEGVSCLVGAGEDWRGVDWKLPEPKVPST